MLREDLRRGFSIYVPLNIALISPNLPLSCLYQPSERRSRNRLRWGSLGMAMPFHWPILSILNLPQGYTDILIVPNDKSLRTIHLHCRQCSTWSHEVTIIAA